MSQLTTLSFQCIHNGYIQKTFEVTKNPTFCLPSPDYQADTQKLLLPQVPALSLEAVLRGKMSRVRD